jgi:hypothetical protein
MSAEESLIIRKPWNSIANAVPRLNLCSFFGVLRLDGALASAINEPRREGRSATESILGLAGLLMRSAPL